MRLLVPQPLTPETFAPFGQVVYPIEDHQPYDRTAAQLQLHGGIPRLYLMRLPHRPKVFTYLTRHSLCTQCLGAIAGEPWELVVAPIGPHPDPDAIIAFRISGPCFINLYCGTWHMGPYFDCPTMDFYNLELSDTNLGDRQKFLLPQPCEIR